MGSKPVHTGLQILAESLAPPGGRNIAIRRAVRHVTFFYSLNATPLNAATSPAFDVATWVKAP
jgi:hypothetical protein